MLSGGQKAEACNIFINWKGKQNFRKKEVDWVKDFLSSYFNNNLYVCLNGK